MKKLLAIVLFCLLALVMLEPRLKAQTAGGALVVSTCGTLAMNFAVGSTRQLTVNTSGQVCQ